MPASKNGRGFDAKATPQHNAKVHLKQPLDEEKRNKVPEAIKAPGLRWYVCTTAPMAELRAADSLRNVEVNGTKPFVPYAPCEFFWRRPLRGNLKMPPREFQRPSMRHYLFVGIRGGINDDVMAALRARDIDGKNVHGLVSILGSHMKGARALNDKGLDWLNELAEDERSGATNMTKAPPYERDEEVRIGIGPFVGFISRVLAVDVEGQEVIVALSLMGVETEIRLDFEDAHKAA
jgi:transcriptional antiterminator NusG